MIHRLIVTALLAAMAMLSAAQVPDSMAMCFDNRVITDIEGVWQWTSGAQVTAMLDEKGALTLTLIDSPDPMLHTPLVLGHGTFAGKDGTYNISLHTTVNPSTGTFTSKTARFVVRVDSHNRLALTPYSTGLTVNLRRWLPYLFRLSINRAEAPDGIEGAVRIYPPQGTTINPIVL